MSEQKQGRYLSEVIDYDHDIEPYSFIKIYAGVGSGKNTLIDRLVQNGFIANQGNASETTCVKPKNILLISSRRAKVEEQLERADVVYDPLILMSTFLPDWMANDPKYENRYDAPVISLPSLSGWGEPQVYEQSAVLTNAKVEHSIMKNYMPGEAATHPWRRFDMIVIDEVHSLLADASYQSAPFYVRRLIEKTLEENKACKVIVMTGSPQILEGIPLFEEAHKVDLMERCENVTPASICFITAEEAEGMQKAMLQKGEKFIAFYNHINPMLRMLDVMPDKVVVSFSDAEKQNNLKETKPTAYRRMMEVKNKLAVEQRLPDDVTAFLTTSRNKEGINIRNDDIEAMFVETRVDIDIVQMAGRVRRGVKTLYVVVDGVQYPEKESRYEAELARRDDFLEAINRKFREICRATDFDPDEADRCETVLKHQDRKEYIEYIHEKFPYVRYDYFTDRFVFYPERELSKRYYAQQNERFERARQEVGGLIRLAQEWYPGIPCTVSRQAQPMADKRKIVEDYLREKGYLGAEKISGLERAVILKELNALLGENRKKLQTLLNCYGFEKRTCSKSKKTEAGFVIVPMDE